MLDQQFSTTGRPQEMSEYMQQAGFAYRMRTRSVATDPTFSGDEERRISSSEQGLNNSRAKSWALRSGATRRVGRNGDHAFRGGRPVALNAVVRRSGRPAARSERDRRAARARHVGSDRERITRRRARHSRRRHGPALHRATSASSQASTTRTNRAYRDHGRVSAAAVSGRWFDPQR